MDRHRMAETHTQIVMEGSWESIGKHQAGSGGASGCTEKHTEENEGLMSGDRMWTDRDIIQVTNNTWQVRSD